MGTASNYALFTVVGAFSNNGGTLVKGNIGTNSGALTGFPPGEVMGETHVANASSLQTANDVTAAYAELTATGCTAPISASIGGQTLTAGVYCQSGSSASDLTGVLTLDGQGNPNAVFIIKLTGALSTATGSSIVLINGASFENVYFQVNGAVNLGIGSVFKGTILANGAISLLTGASLQGRALSIAGEINLDANKVNVAPDLTPSIFSNGATYNANEQKDVVLVIYNIGPVATTSPVTFEFNKLTPSFTTSINSTATTATVTGNGSVDNTEWTFTEQATRYVVTLKDGFSISAGANKKIVIQVTATNTPNAAATITARVFNGTGGGETPTTNNSAVYRISINDSNN
ncbi:ice-binding family protein [Salmonirosea aquatica]|uniref:ice-binding family protein n=1 Tax=Salmonirosea aquatica TaxID=2654236 RepID=UPI003570A519